MDTRANAALQRGQHWSAMIEQESGQDPESIEELPASMMPRSACESDWDRHEQMRQLRRLENRRIRKEISRLEQAADQQVILRRRYR
jgi:hypothetical protein